MIKHKPIIGSVVIGNITSKSSDSCPGPYHCSLPFRVLGGLSLTLLNGTFPPHHLGSHSVIISFPITTERPGYTSLSCLSTDLSLLWQLSSYAVLQQLLHWNGWEPLSYPPPPPANLCKIHCFKAPNRAALWVLSFSDTDVVLFKQ